MNKGTLFENVDIAKYCKYEFVKITYTVKDDFQNTKNRSIVVIMN